MDADSRPSCPPLPAIGDRLAGKYELTESLQSGGMGIVMAARHVGLGKAVAIKLLKPEHARDEDACRRFLREGRMAAQLTSEHVARVMDTGETSGGVPFIVMERLDGSSLAKVLDERALEVTEAVDLVLQAIEAVAEAHRLGVVHRDLKPSNLFLCARTDGSPLVKVLDFGIAKAVLPEPGEHRFTGTGQILGSPNYMSPEQVRDSSSVDHLTDVWSLGCTLYELIGRQPPFDAEYLSALCAMVVADPHRPLRELVAEVPEGLEAVVDRCLAKKRRDRFANVVELAAALEPFASDEGRASVRRIARIGATAEPDPEQDEAAGEPRSPRADDTLAASWRAPSRGATSWLGLLTVVAVGALAIWLAGDDGAPAPTQSSVTSGETARPFEAEAEPPATNVEPAASAGMENADAPAASPVEPSAPSTATTPPKPVGTPPPVAGKATALPRGKGIDDADADGPAASAGPNADGSSADGSSADGSSVDADGSSADADGSGADADGSGADADAPPPLTTAGPLADRE